MVEKLGVVATSDEVRLKGTTINLSDWQHSSDPTKLDSTKIYPGGIELSAHGSRHNRGGDDPMDYSLISQLVDSGDVDCGVGTGGEATRTTVYSLPANWQNIIPLAVYMEVGGTVATDETIDISVKAVLDDGTELEIASYSVTGGTGSKTEGTPFANLLAALRAAGVTKDGNRITSIVADVKSSATSTSATVTVRVVGIRT